MIGHKIPLLLLSTLLCSTLVMATCQVGQCNGGVCIPYLLPQVSSFCSCPSGFRGSNCSEMIVPTASPCNFNSVTGLQTEFIPSGVSIHFSGGVVNVELSTPLVTERRFTTVSIDKKVTDGSESTLFPPT